MCFGGLCGPAGRGGSKCWVCSLQKERQLDLAGSEDCSMRCHGQFRSCVGKGMALMEGAETHGFV